MDLCEPFSTNIKHGSENVEHVSQNSSTCWTKRADKKKESASHCAMYKRTSREHMFDERGASSLFDVCCRFEVLELEDETRPRP